VGLPGQRCPETRPLLKGLHDLPALSLRGGQALHHPAHLPDSSGSDSPGRAPDSALFSVGGTAGGSSGVVSRSGVTQWGGAVQQVPRDAADAHHPPPKVLHLFFGFAVSPLPLSASFCAPFVLKDSSCSLFGMFSSPCLPVHPLVFSRSSANRRSFLVLTHG